MSNAARLSAVIVLVVVAAIGLSIAFFWPAAGSTAPVAPAGGTAAPEAIAPVGSGEGATSTTESLGAPAPEAFAPGAGAAVGAAATGTAGKGSSAPTTGAAGATTGSQAAKPAGAGAVVPTGSGAPSSIVLADPGPPAPAAPVGADYVVKSGDTLEAIARAQLGDGQKWRSIVELNPGLDPKNLKVGQKIKLPAGGTVAKARDSAPAGGSAAADGNTYTVQKGDTLMAISRKVYGSEASWKRILEANAGTLKGDASALKPGMKLTIPPKR